MSTLRLKRIRDIIKLSEDSVSHSKIDLGKEKSMIKAKTLEEALEEITIKCNEAEKKYDDLKGIKDNLEKTIKEKNPSVDYLQHMFVRREEFMNLLAKKMPKTHPDHWPLDLSKKENQQFLRDVGTRGIEEIWEMLRELRNWKPHRQTNIDEFDRDKFLEEFVDGLNYLFSVLIFAGLNADDLFEAYCKKDEIIRQRIESGY